MKRVISVCTIAVRQTVWKLLAIIAAMSATELLLFCRLLPRTPLEPGEAGFIRHQFDQLLDHAWFSWVLLAALVALYVVQVSQGSHSNKLTYRLRLVPMGERSVTLLWAGVHMVSYWILWAAQLTVVMVCWKLYTAYDPNHATTLELFTKFYYSGFLHGLIPLQDYARVAATALMFPALGLGAAYMGLLTRNGRKPILPLILISVTMSIFPADYQDGIKSELLLLIYVVSVAYMAWKIGWWNDEED